MAPWRLSGGPTVVAEIYPAYDATARMLERMGVPPDFEAEGGVRYIHRREGDTDLYFVAHRETEARTVACRFRVAGRQPEWWDPLTGARRILPEFTQRDGITTVPIAFDALGSGFVVFRDPAPSAATTGRNFPNRRAVATLEGPWDVSFDPAWGGPARATFATLEDWSTHAEPSIRHFSGTAVYRKTFDGPALSSRSGRLFLDLGAVQVMARVSLNGRDLGVAWCVPWQVEIPPGLLRAQGNQLEVAVANLWVNRLIGDSGLPAEQRKTWTTYNPYKPDSPLLPSGLLGPVRVLVE